MVDLENEVRCLMHLKAYCEDALAAYPQSLDQDMAILHEDD
jgi:hypothetical protein